MIVKMAQPPPFDADQARTGKKGYVMLHYLRTNNEYFWGKFKKILFIKYYLQ